MTTKISKHIYISSDQFAQAEWRKILSDLGIEKNDILTFNKTELKDACESLSKHIQKKNA